MSIADVPRAQVPTMLVAEAAARCGTPSGDPVDARFSSQFAVSGTVVRLCGLDRASYPRIRLFLVPTRGAQKLGDAQSGVRDPLRVLPTGSRALSPVKGSQFLRVTIPAVKPGEYTLAYWCKTCHGLLGTVWPNISMGSNAGFARVHVAS
jgi:hypothetical protein